MKLHPLQAETASTLAQENLTGVLILFVVQRGMLTKGFLPSRRRKTKSAK
jgi:hypothetical protein